MELLLQDNQTKLGQKEEQVKQVTRSNADALNRVEEDNKRLVREHDIEIQSKAKFVNLLFK